MSTNTFYYRRSRIIFIFWVYEVTITSFCHITFVVLSYFLKYQTPNFRKSFIVFLYYLPSHRVPRYYKNLVMNKTFYHTQLLTLTKTLHIKL